MKVVLDTGPVLAFIRRDDPAHHVATDLIARQFDFLIPDPVVVETDYMVRTRWSPDAARAFLEDVEAGVFQRIPVDAGLFKRAAEYDRTFADLDLGIVDASIMALAERERALIFTFDFADFRATRPLRGGWWRLLLDEDSFWRLVRLR